MQHPRRVRIALHVARPVWTSLSPSLFLSLSLAVAIAVLSELLSLLALIAVIESENVFLLICAMAKMCLGVTRGTLPPRRGRSKRLEGRGRGELALVDCQWVDAAQGQHAKNAHSVPHAATLLQTLSVCCINKNL